MSRSRNTERGFSLMELLMSILIGGIVLGVITATFTSQSKSFDAQEQVNEMQQNVRAVMDMMTREIRLAGYDPTDAGIVGIPYSASQLQIIADLDGDGDTTATTEPNENITYSYDDPNDRILRNASGGNQTFAENIQAFTFDYLDSNSSSTSVAANIRQIKIIITGKTAEGDPYYSPNGGYRTYTLTSFVTSRNLAY